MDNHDFLNEFEKTLKYFKIFFNELIYVKKKHICMWKMFINEYWERIYVFEICSGIFFWIKLYRSHGLSRNTCDNHYVNITCITPSNQVGYDSVLNTHDIFTTDYPPPTPHSSHLNISITLPVSLDQVQIIWYNIFIMVCARRSTTRTQKTISYS